MKVTQFEAATIQLETAIKLYFQDIDILSVCTLSGAADRIFEDLIEKKQNCNEVSKSKPSMYCITKAFIKEEHQKSFFKNYYRKHQNFLKHADRNYGETLEFKDGVAEVELFIASMNYLTLSDKTTAPISHCIYWIIANNPELLKDKIETEDAPINYISDYIKKHGKQKAKAHIYDALKISCPYLFSKSERTSFETVSSESFDYFIRQFNGITM